MKLLLPDHVELRPYQLRAVRDLTLGLREYGAVLDASETGLGKTFHALVTALNLPGHHVAILCPAKGVTKWKHAVRDVLGIEPVFVLSWEKARSGKHGIGKSGSKSVRFLYDLPPSTILIVDEVQNASGQSSLNSKLLRDAKLDQVKIIMLSATPFENPLQMKGIGFVLGLHYWANFWQWALKLGARRSFFGGGRALEWPKNLNDDRNRKARETMNSIHSYIFEGKIKRGVRITRHDADVLLPNIEVISEIVDIQLSHEDKKSLAPYFEMVLAAENKDSMEAIKQEREVLEVTLSLRKAQMVEISKIPYIIERATELRAKGYSVPIFVRFTFTRLALMRRLEARGIYGGQSASERVDSLNSFQNNANSILILNIDAGSDLIDLHDLHGSHPRHSLVCPTDKAKQLIQVCGRIERHGSKSRGINAFIFAAGTVEEKTARNVQRKVDNISTLTDGDLSALRFYDN